MNTMPEPEELLSKAEAFLTEEKFQDALNLSEELIQLQPESAKAWFLKGKALMLLTEFASAVGALQTAKDHGAVDVDCLLTSAKNQQTLKAVRRDWYQTDTHVVINVLVKKASVDDVNINYGDQLLAFSVKLPGTDLDYELNLSLANKIVPEQCVFKVLGSKVEIKLKKAEGGRWATLESDGSEPTNVKQIEKTNTFIQPPTYPSSSKKTKDWDKLVQKVKEEEKEEKPEGDAALNALFQQIYSDASDETKRAMNKSFQESNGTVLSTNWGEIGNKHTDMQCPDGMEYKKY